MFSFLKRYFNNKSESEELKQDDVSKSKCNIILLRIHVGASVADHRFLTMVRTLKKLGYNVKVVTSYINWLVHDTDILPDTIQTGSWLPKKIWNRFQHPLYLLRCIYASLWITFHKSSLKPDLVLLHSNNIALPVLKMLGRMRVIHFQNFPELMLKNNTEEMYKAVRNKFYPQFLNFADEIIVSNRYMQEIFNLSFPKVNKEKLSVMYSCVETPYFQNCPVNPLRRVVPSVAESDLIFLALGPLHEISNFELAIQAFFRLINRCSRKMDTHKRLMLIIGASFTHEESEIRYEEKLRKTILAYKFDKCHRVIVLHVAASFCKKTLLSHCTVYLHTSKYDFQDKSLLEALLLNKIIVATDTRLAREYIKIGENGFISNEPTALEFSKSMNLALEYTQDLSNYSNLMREHDFAEKYGMLRYRNELQELVERNTHNQ